MRKARQVSDRKTGPESEVADPNALSVTQIHVLGDHNQLLAEGP